MAILDDAEANRILDALFGVTTVWSSIEWAIWDGDPSVPGSAEMVDGVGGYARVSGPNDATMFPDAADSRAKTAVPQAFAESTDAWSGVGRFWVAINGDDHIGVITYGPLSAPLDISSGFISDITVTPTLFVPDPRDES